MLKGAADKRLWANRFNGIGGHVEAGEDLLSAACRELAEESSIRGADLRLRGAINIFVGEEGGAPKGVMVFLFTGDVTSDVPLEGSAEGSLAWLPLSHLADYPLVDDLYALIPRLFATQGAIYGHYTPDENGTMRYQFVNGA